MDRNYTLMCICNKVIVVIYAFDWPKFIWLTRNATYLWILQVSVLRTFGISPLRKIWRTNMLCLHLMYSPGSTKVWNLATVSRYNGVNWEKNLEKCMDHALTLFLEVIQMAPLSKLELAPTNWQSLLQRWIMVHCPSMYLSVWAALKLCTIVILTAVMHGTSPVRPVVTLTLQQRKVRLLNASTIHSSKP